MEEDSNLMLMLIALFALYAICTDERMGRGSGGMRTDVSEYLNCAMRIFDGEIVGFAVSCASNAKNVLN